MLRLAADTTELVLAPGAGGSITAFRWRGMDLLRGGDPAAGLLALASFPLLPFSNRIGGGRFTAAGRSVILPANSVQAGRPQTIHGFGWQAAWAVADAGPRHARLVHRHGGEAWPWPYVAEQHFRLADGELELALSLTNFGTSPMPAGMGIHPYFPRAGAQLRLAVDGRWDNDADGLPTRWSPLEATPDWFGGDPVDHCFTGRAGPILLRWPDRALTMTPDPTLGHVIVYVPAGEDYFCVEPVSHLTNAVNRDEPDEATGLRWLAPGETWTVTLHFAASN